MRAEVNWNEISNLISALYEASDRLEELFPGRKFTLDGHLVGSLGEVIAGFMFQLDLLPASSHAHDALAEDGRRVEIKMTQGNGVALRYEPEHLIVLKRAKGTLVKVIYNGPGKACWDNAGKMQKNGQRPISLTKLRKLDEVVAESARLPVLNPSPM